MADPNGYPAKEAAIRNRSSNRQRAAWSQNSHLRVVGLVNRMRNKRLLDPQAKS
jgi:hypothetical protein